MLPASEQEKWERDFLAGIEGSEDGQMFSISPQLAQLLIGPLTRYYEQLQAKLGNPDPINPIDIDAESGIDPTEAKWGAGDGWRYYCTHDLLKACEVSLKTGVNIVISFD